MHSKKLMYILTYLIIGFSAFNFFINQPELKYAFMLVVTLLAIHFKIKIHRNLLYILLFFLIIVLLQYIVVGQKFDNMIKYFFYQSFYLIFIPYVLITLIGFRYPKIAINIIYVYAIISLVFWAITNISPSFHQFLYSLAERLGTDPIDTSNILAGRPEQFILYTYEAERAGPFLRNPGPFHEPGAFAVFLIYGLIFNSIIENKWKNRKNLIMTVALLTTFSTAGYVAFFIILNYYAVVSKRVQTVIKPIVIGASVCLSLFLFFRLEFLNVKVSRQYEKQSEVRLDSATTGRFFSARKALVVLERYPLTGKINFNLKRDITSEEAVGYGFMILAAELGIPIIILLFYYSYRSIRLYCQTSGTDKKYAIFSMLGLLVVLFSETFSKTIFFQMLFLTSFTLNNKSALLKVTKP